MLPPGARPAPSAPPVSEEASARLSLTIEDVTRVFPMDPKVWEPVRFTYYLPRQPLVVWGGSMTIHAAGTLRPSHQFFSESRAYATDAEAQASFQVIAHGNSPMNLRRDEKVTDWSDRVSLGQQRKVILRAHSVMEALFLQSRRVLFVYVEGFQFTDPQQVTRLAQAWIARNVATPQKP